MIYAWLLVGFFIAVSGGLLIAALRGPGGMEDMRGLSDGDPRLAQGEPGGADSRCESASPVAVHSPKGPA